MRKRSSSRESRGSTVSDSETCLFVRGYPKQTSPESDSPRFRVLWPSSTNDRAGVTRGRLRPVMARAATAVIRRKLERCPSLRKLPSQHTAEGPHGGRNARPSRADQEPPPRACRLAFWGVRLNGKSGRAADWPARALQSLSSNRVQRQMQRIRRQCPAAFKASRVHAWLCSPPHQGTGFAHRCRGAP